MWDPERKWYKLVEIFQLEPPKSVKIESFVYEAIQLH